MPVDAATFAEVIRRDKILRRNRRLNGDARQLLADDSKAHNRLVYDDCLPTSLNAAAATPQTKESWANLTAWNDPTKMQVSGGRLYALGATADATTGINQAISRATGQVIRKVTQYTNVAGGTGGLAVGVSTGTAGGVFAASTFHGLFHHDNLWKVIDAGVETFPDGAGNATAGSGSYIVTETLDDYTYSIVVHSQLDTTLTWSKSWPRTGAGSIVPTNWSFYGTHSLGTSGKSFGPTVFVPAHTTAVPRSGVEGVGRTGYRTTIPVVTAGVTSNCPVLLMLPPSYDPRRPVPLAVMFHGNGANETQQITEANMKKVASALLDAGFATLSVANGTTTWGAQKALDGYTSAVLWAKSQIAVSAIVMFANSMGGIESELVLAEDRVPGVVAWVGTSPTANLNACYTEGDTSFVSVINGAYGITGTAPNDYATLTAGHDPALKPGYAFRGVPMMFLAATDDTTVLKAHNADVLAANVAAYSPEVVNVAGITGAHAFDVTNYVTSIVAFFKKYTAKLP